MVVSRAWESSFISKISLPLLDPSLAIWRAFTFEIEKSAVSEDEKKPDKKRQKINRVTSKVMETKILKFYKKLYSGFTLIGFVLICQILDFPYVTCRLTRD